MSHAYFEHRFRASGAEEHARKAPRPTSARADILLPASPVDVGRDRHYSEAADVYTRPILSLDTASSAKDPFPVLSQRLSSTTQQATMSTTPERLRNDPDDITPRLTRSRRQRGLSGDSPDAEAGNITSSTTPSASTNNHQNGLNLFPGHGSQGLQRSGPSSLAVAPHLPYPLDSPLRSSLNLESPRDEAEETGSSGSRYSEEGGQYSAGTLSDEWTGVDYPANSPPKSALLSREFDQLEGMGLFDPFAEDGAVDRISNISGSFNSRGNSMVEGELGDWMRRSPGSPSKVRESGNWWDQAGDFYSTEAEQKWDLPQGSVGSAGLASNEVEASTGDVSPSQVGLVLQGTPSEGACISTPQPSSYQPRRPSGSATPPASFDPEPSNPTSTLEDYVQVDYTSSAQPSGVSVALEQNLAPIVTIVRQPQVGSTRASSRGSSHRLSSAPSNYTNSQPSTPISPTGPELSSLPSVLESPPPPSAVDPPSPPLDLTISDILREPAPLEQLLHVEEYLPPTVSVVESSQSTSTPLESPLKKERSPARPILSAKSTKRSPILVSPSTPECVPSDSRGPSASTSTLGLSPTPEMSSSRLSSASDFALMYGAFDHYDASPSSPIPSSQPDFPSDTPTPIYPRDAGHSAEHSNLSIIEELDAQLSEAISNIDFGSPSASLTDPHSTIPPLVGSQISPAKSSQQPTTSTASPSTLSSIDAAEVATPAVVVQTEARARAVAFIADLKKARAAAVALEAPSTSESPSLFSPEAPPKEGVEDVSNVTPSQERESYLDTTPRPSHSASTFPPFTESRLPDVPSSRSESNQPTPAKNASFALQNATVETSARRTSTTPAPASRNRLLPVATHTLDLRQAKNSAERCRLYAAKIHSLTAAESGLDVWTRSVQDRKTPPVTVAAVQERQHPRAEASQASTLTFPSRPSDSYRAREIPRGQFGSQDLLPTVPYPGVLQTSIHGSMSTGALTSRYSPQGSSKTPSILGKNSFFSNLSRKTSKRSAPPLTSPTTATITAPIQYSSSTLPSPSGRPTGPRMPGAPRLSFDGSSVRTLSPIPFAPMKALSPPPMDPEKLQRVADILPEADRNELELILRQVGGDEVSAISRYLARSQ